MATSYPTSHPTSPSNPIPIPFTSSSTERDYVSSRLAILWSNGSGSTITLAGQSTESAVRPTVPFGASLTCLTGEPWLTMKE
ncbi:hypothetical protein LINPERHAP2_LOCUS33597 [Linum perenne]